MNKHLILALALIAVVISGCKKDQAKSDISVTLECGNGEYRQAHAKECQGFDENFTVKKEDADIMKKLSE